MKVLFKSKNLLGDSLQATPAILAFCEKHKPELVHVLTDPNYIATVFDHIGPDIKPLTAPAREVNEDEYDFVFDFDISKAWRIGTLNNIPACVAFGIMLGFELTPAVPVFYPDPEALAWAEKESTENGPFVLFQPYSVSCSSWTNELPNKRWKDEHWAEMYKHIRKETGLAVRILGGPKDQKNYVIPGIPEDDHLFGMSLDKVAALQRYALFVLSLDSGVAHLAASQFANMLELYPMCLPSNWMSNLANQNARIIHATPWDLPFDFVWSYVRSELVTLLGSRGLQPCPIEESASTEA